MRPTLKSCILVLLLLTFFFIQCLHANNDRQIFQELFTKWSKGFNQKDLKVACSLFSKNISADYQGVPSKNYAAICNGFKKIFAEEKIYNYHFKLHQVYRNENLAAVRITWFLTIKDNGKIISRIQDEGIDVFLKDQHGQWKIINYIGYPAKSFMQNGKE